MKMQQRFNSRLARISYKRFRKNGQKSNKLEDEELRGSRLSSNVTRGCVRVTYIRLSYDLYKKIWHFTNGITKNELVTEYRM